MPRPRILLLFPTSLLLCLFLAACTVGGHGGGGGGGTPSLDLSFQSTGSTQAITLIAGSSGTVNFVVLNGGTLATSSATTVSVSLTSVSGVTFSSGGGGTSGWNCGASTSTLVSCTTSAMIAAGATAPTLTVNLNAASNGQSIGATPTVSNANDTVPSDNSYTLNITVVIPPDVTVTKTHVGTNFTAGNNGQYTIVVNNTGAGPAYNVKVTDILPTGLTYVSAASGNQVPGSGGSWNSAASRQTVTCTLASAVNAGAAATTLTLTVTVAGNAPASISNTATVTATNDTGTTGKSSTDTVTVVLPTGSVSVTITNPGSSSISVGTGGTQNFVATLTNFTTNQINWTVNGVSGGNSTVRTITASTTTGATAVYTAPASVPTPATFTVQATAVQNPLAFATVTVTIVLNQNAVLKGQFAFTLHGFQPSGLPLAMIGTVTAAGDTTGTLSNILIDSNTATTLTTSTFVAKTPPRLRETAATAWIRLPMASCTCRCKATRRLR